jgi:hypothetical protein
MATFHTNGRIISNPPLVSHKADPQSSAQSSSSSNNNKIRTTYASQIVSKDKSSVTNQASSSEPSVLRINQVSEVQNLKTAQQPAQKKNNVALAVFMKPAKDKELKCTDQLNQQIHPENPCLVCTSDRWGSRWKHKNEIEDTECGKWVYVPPASCEFQRTPLPPCWSCDKIRGKYFSCEDCEDCVENGINPFTGKQEYQCKDICLDNKTCTDNGCVKFCVDSSDCSWQECETCNDANICKPSCGSGSKCIEGNCESGCFKPTCDPLKCETCEYKNGVYGCSSPPTSNSRGERLVCCDGSLVVAEYEDCYTFQDCDNRQVPICPPGTECYGGANTNSGRQCRDIGCRFDSDCNPLCCEQCTKVTSQEDGSYTNMCLPCGAGSIYSRSPGTSCFNGQCVPDASIMESIKRALNCISKCQSLKYKDTPECSDNIALCSAKVSCYTCNDDCAEASILYKKKLVCTGTGECKDPYEIKVTSLSLDIIP